MMRVTMGRGHRFTAIEMIVVVAIIGVLAALIISGMRASTEAARKGQAQMDISTIYKALEEYKFKFGEYLTIPAGDLAFTGAINSTATPLDTLVKLRLLTLDQSRRDEANNVFNDPWGKPYCCSGTVPDSAVADMAGVGGTIYIFSYGTGSLSTPDGEKAEKWAYIKGGK